MTWEAHQRLGFFGFTVKAGSKAPPQPRHLAVVNIDEALASVGDILDAWRRWVAWPESPPWSGGVLDSWPARMAEGLAICRAEFEAVLAYQRSQEVSRG